MMRAVSFSEKLARRSPFFYGWAIVYAAGSVNASRNVAGNLTLSVFMVPMSDDLGWSRTLIAGAVSVAGIIAIFTSPITGWLLQKIGPRILLGSSVAILGLSTMAIGWVSLPIAFYAVFCVARVIFLSPVPIGGTTVVSHWFQRHRGRALGVLGVSHSLGMGLMPLLAQLLINAVGWRMAWFWLGVTVWAIALAPAWLLLIRRPEDVGMSPDYRMPPQEAPVGGIDTSPSQRSGPEWTLREAARTWALWGLALMGGLLFFIYAGVNLHQAAFLRDKGISPTTAAGAITVLAVGTGVGSIVWGLVAERWPVRRVYVALAGITGGGALLYLIVDTPLEAFVVAALFGFSLGGMLVMPSAALADYFGRRSLGLIRGVTEPFVGVGQAIGAVGAAIIFDLTDSYTAIFPILAGVALGSAVLALTTGPPSEPGKKLVDSTADGGRGSIQTPEHGPSFT